MEENKIVDNTIQYVVVAVGNEQYGIDISYVDNIVRMQKIARVPKAQPYFKGVINIRGEIIPVMSLRIKFDLQPDEYTAKTRILKLKLEQSAAVGIIVDEVKEVVTLADESIDKSHSGNQDDKSAYISGVGKHDGGLISILNLPNVIIEKEVNA